MEYKLPPIEVPQEDPFRFDALDRRASVEIPASLLEALKAPSLEYVAKKIDLATQFEP